jgi:hypothetical protein
MFRHAFAFFYLLSVIYTEFFLSLVAAKCLSRSKASIYLFLASLLMQSGSKLVLFIMDFNLLKKILPGEVIEYTTRNGVRATDGREFAQHRAY